MATIYHTIFFTEHSKILRYHTLLCKNVLNMPSDVTMSFEATFFECSRKDLLTVPLYLVYVCYVCFKQQILAAKGTINTCILKNASTVLVKEVDFYVPPKI